MDFIEQLQAPTVDLDTIRSTQWNAWNTARNTTKKYQKMGQIYANPEEALPVFFRSIL